MGMCWSNPILASSSSYCHFYETFKEMLTSIWKERHQGKLVDIIGMKVHSRMPHFMLYKYKGTHWNNILRQSSRKISLHDMEHCRNTNSFAITAFIFKCHLFFKIHTINVNILRYLLQLHIKLMTFSTQFLENMAISAFNGDNCHRGRAIYWNMICFSPNCTHARSQMAFFALLLTNWDLSVPSAQGCGGCSIDNECLHLRFVLWLPSLTCECQQYYIFR